METATDEVHLGWDDFPCSSSSSSPPDRYVSSWRQWGDNDRICSGGDLSHCADSTVDGWSEFNPCSSKELVETFGEEESDSKHAGLINLGNTCFLNAVLQCLTYTPPLANTLLRNEHNVSCQVRGFCGMCAMEAHIKTVLNTLGGTVSPSFLADNLTQISKSFVPGEQQDAHECFFFLIEVLQRCCMSNPGSMAPNCTVDDTSFVSDIFIGKIRSQVRCNSCLHGSDSVEAFLGLSLDVENSFSVDEALANFMAVEELQEDIKVCCLKCKVESNRSKQLSFDKSPQVLVIQLKRFKTASLIFPTKIEKNIAYGISLDLTSFVSKNDSVPIMEHDWKYQLYAVLVHSGWCTTSGHYYCYVQTSPGVWHWMNDSVVTRVSEETVLCQEAYMLFYIRKGIDQILSPPATSSISEEACSDRSCQKKPFVENPSAEIDYHESQVVSLPQNEEEIDHHQSLEEGAESEHGTASFVESGLLDQNCRHQFKSSDLVDESQIIELKGPQSVDVHGSGLMQPPLSVAEVSSDDKNKGCLNSVEVDRRLTSTFPTSQITDTNTQTGCSLQEQSLRRLLSHMPSRRRRALLESTLTNAQATPPDRLNVKAQHRAVDSKISKKSKKQDYAAKAAVVDDTSSAPMNKRNGGITFQENQWRNDSNQAVAESRKLQRVGGKRVTPFIELGARHQHPQKVSTMVDG